MRRGARAFALLWLSAWLCIGWLAGLAKGPGTLDVERMRAVMAQRYGNAGLEALEAWQGLLARAEGMPEAEQLAEVNRFFNLRTHYTEDIDVWGVADHWATPLETLGLGRADCEDYAIAKYVTLRLLGVPDERLRMIYVRADHEGRVRAHMVLGHYERPDAVPLVLDSLRAELLPATQRPDLQPVFSFNSVGLWVGPGHAPVADPTARLSRWRDVLARMQQEGIR